jgi:hypothetical protein
MQQATDNPRSDRDFPVSHAECAYRGPWPGDANLLTLVAGCAQGGLVGEIRRQQVGDFRIMRLMTGETVDRGSTFA